MWGGLVQRGKFFVRTVFRLFVQRKTALSQTTPCPKPPPSTLSASKLSRYFFEMIITMKTEKKNFSVKIIQK
jgi:hypothetical protein